MQERSEDSMLFIKNSKEFLKGQLNNIVVNVEDKNRANLTLKKDDKNYVNSGVYTSEIFNTDSFSKLIVSWNAQTPINTYIEVEARVFITNQDKKDNGKWSEWVSWGKWGTEIFRKSEDTKYNDIEIDTDTVNIKENKIASKIQLKVILVSIDSKNTPMLNQISATYINEYKKFDSIDINNSEFTSIIIETPCISQKLREKSIASRICSPTSITMLLNRFGKNLIVEDVAWKCFDYKYNGFGNWVYNVAFAGSLGYEAYVEFGNLEVLKREIFNGYPVAVSVKYTNDKNNKKYPYVKGAPVTTAGHLIVVCGLECDANGQKFIIVNDPAGKDNESVRLKYNLNEFIEAWNTSNNVMYVVH